MSLLVLALGMCACFAAAGAWTVWALSVTGTAPESPQVTLRFLFRALGFSVLSAVILGALISGKRPTAPATPLEPMHALLPPHPAPLLGLLAIVGLLAFANLDAYPRAEPDETYHVIVARNLAVHGLYASGHPDTGFTVFDPYDSVGPTVIAPIATVFHLTGPGLVAGRAVMGLYLILLICVAYLFARPVFGPRAAWAGAAMAAGAFGSVYLGRTLYGEVPAFFYLLCGLLFWRIALERPPGYGPALAAGACFGFAVLTKTILLFAAFPVLGAWLHDRLNGRKIAFRHLALPAAGLLAALSAWSLVQAMAGSESVGAQNPLVYYRHYLMFGLGSLARPLHWFAGQPIAWLTGIAAVVYALPRIATRRYDPPSIALFLTAVLFAFWWTFFTPGQIPRYMYFTCAAVAVLSGPLLTDAWTAAARARGPRRLTPLAALALVAAPAIYRTGVQADRVFFHDEMADDRALAQFVASQPPGISLGTTYFPAERMLNFMTGRAVALDDDALGCDLLIVNQNTGAVLPEGYTKIADIGRYIAGTPQGTSPHP